MSILLVIWVCPHDQSVRHKHNQNSLTILVATDWGCVVQTTCKIRFGVVFVTYMCCMFVIILHLDFCTWEISNLNMIKIPSQNKMQTGNSFISHDRFFPCESQICRATFSLMMDIPWLFAALIGLAATKVSCQPNFGNVPPLPTKGLSNLKIQLPAKYIALYNNCLTLSQS